MDILNLTDDQKTLLDRGVAVELVVGTTECVVVRADVYQRRQVAFNDGLSMAQVGRLVEQNMQEYDADDPLLDSYQQR